MGERLIRFDEVMKRTGFCRAWIYKLKARGEFPRTVHTGRRCVAFIESEVDSWIENKINQERDAAEQDAK